MNKINEEKWAIKIDYNRKGEWKQFQHGSDGRVTYNSPEEANKALAKLKNVFHAKSGDSILNLHGFKVDMLNESDRIRNIIREEISKLKEIGNFHDPRMSSGKFDHLGPKKEHTARPIFVRGTLDNAIIEYDGELFTGVEFERDEVIEKHGHVNEVSYKANEGGFEFHVNVTETYGGEVEDMDWDTLEAEDVSKGSMDHMFGGNPLDDFPSIREGDEDEPSDEEYDEMAKDAKQDSLARRAADLGYLDI